MKLSDIKRVLILGAGTMGQQIGLEFAIHGYEVVFYDLTDEILEKAVKRVAKLGAWYASTGRITSEQLQQTLARVSSTTDPAEAAREADLVSESVLEEPEVKAKVFARFNQLCPERTGSARFTSTTCGQTMWWTSCPTRAPTRR